MLALSLVAIVYLGLMQWAQNRKNSSKEKFVSLEYKGFPVTELKGKGKQDWILTVCRGQNVCQNFSWVGCASRKAKSYKSFLDVQEGKIQKCVSLEIATKQQTKKQPKGSVQWVAACMEEVLLGASLFWSEDRFNEAELCVLNLE